MSAGLVWPVAGPPIPNGAVLCTPEGRIEALGPDDQVGRPDAAAAYRFPHAVLLPGLVNAHTHLELTSLRGAVPEHEFVAWIRHVRRAKEGLSDEAYQRAAEAGVREAWRHGTTTVGDTGTSGAVALVLARLRGRGVVYHEAIAPDARDAEQTFERCVAALDHLRSQVSSQVVVGVSPHAPYTVSRTLYRLVAEHARREALPVAAHIAESHAEVAFVTRGQGAFAESWNERGIALEPPCASPVALLEEVGLLDTRLLAIHAVQTDATDLERLQRAGAAVAACPRSNARHGHGEAPLARYLEAGLLLGLGTDSVASVDDLDLLAEARLAATLAGLSPDAALALVTAGGAAALGLDGHVGTLAPGKEADLCVVEVPEGVADPAARAAAVLEGGARAIVATFLAGRLVYGRETTNPTPADP